MKVGTQTLSTNVYENDRNGLLKEVQYGNGGRVKYAYDDFDRLTGVRHDAETADRYDILCERWREPLGAVFCAEETGLFFCR